MSSKHVKPDQGMTAAKRSFFVSARRPAPVRRAYWKAAALMRPSSKHASFSREIYRSLSRYRLSVRDSFAERKPDRSPSGVWAFSWVYLRFLFRPLQLFVQSHP